MIAHWDEVARDADLAEAAGAVAVSSASVNFGHLEPGHDGASPHCHSADEELFVFFEGGATFERPCHLAAPQHWCLACVPRG